jgi:hypothetical protein
MALRKGLVAVAVSSWCDAEIDASQERGHSLCLLQRRPASAEGHATQAGVILLQRCAVIPAA